ncbi:hypothetical protein [Hymenobacter cellulosilyticus]|uniref:HEAT repeat domain-containing protein n=1 Tax=Hymenobacter cellulosilyticus TaxID=2932248 RepID=A0A8T9Q4B1_9BACT|nr:hypothetical protein [Hymenobacter cellulosilyticus]UOQ72556.1 hypothetical protein MUN79_00690 [Hymenobacter cellulosilyticus]
MLTALRDRQADARALLGLGYLRSEEALPLLHNLLRQGWYAQYVLGAIAAINPAGLNRTILLEVLLSSTSSKSQLMETLIGIYSSFTLPQVGAKVGQAVLGQLTHSDYLIRYHALDALRKLYSVPSSDNIREDDLFSLICKKDAPGAYRHAQQMFISKVPAATLQQFSLQGS